VVVAHELGESVEEHHAHGVVQHLRMYERRVTCVDGTNGMNKQYVNR